jgi:N-acetylglucosamine-6-phosphate deacetylase
MAPITARRPGLAATALARPDVFVQLIVDGVHLADDLVVMAWRTAGDRCVLVTDATAAATLADGPHDLGGRTVHLAEGAVRLDDGTLAGSCLTMDAAVRNAVDVGIPLVAAVNAATRAPAALLRRPDLGSLRPGGPADIVVLDDDLRIQRVLTGGAVLEG